MKGLIDVGGRSDVSSEHQFRGLEPVERGPEFADPGAVITDGAWASAPLAMSVPAGDGSRAYMATKDQTVDVTGGFPVDEDQKSASPEADEPQADSEGGEV